MPRNTENLVAFNESRHRDGAARQVDRARAALPKLEMAPAQPGWEMRTEAVLQRYRQVVRLRVQYPKATITELAQRAGMTRGRFWSILRRALHMAETMPADDGEMVLF